MSNSDYQRSYVERRYADDPEFRDRCIRSGRDSRLEKDHGITLAQFEAQLTALRALTALLDTLVCVKQPFMRGRRRASVTFAVQHFVPRGLNQPPRYRD